MNAIPQSKVSLAEAFRAFHEDEDGLEALQVVMIVAIRIDYRRSRLFAPAAMLGCLFLNELELVPGNCLRVSGSILPRSSGAPNIWSSAPSCCAVPELQTLRKLAM